MSKNKDRDTFLMKAGHYKMFCNRLSLEQKGHLLDAIFCDQLGEEYEQHISDGLVGMAFDVIRDFYNQCEQAYQQRSDANRANANKRWNNNANNANASDCMQSHNSECISKSKSKTKSISDSQREDKEKVAVAPTPTPRFIKPTVEDVAAYAAELRYIGFDAPAFFDFYEAKGWKVGSQPMKDWKAAVRNWQRGNKDRYPKGVSRDYIQRTQLPNPEDYARIHSTI